MPHFSFSSLFCPFSHPVIANHLMKSFYVSFVFPHSGRKLSLFSLPWSRSFAWNRPWGPSSPTSQWSAHLALSTWSTSWKGELPFFKVSLSVASEADLDVSAASCPLRPSCACTGSWVQISACTPSWLRERRPWTTMRQRTASRGAVQRELRHINLPARGKQPLRIMCGGWGGKRDWIETGALALSRCKGFLYCSSGTKKAVYYTKGVCVCVCVCVCVSH